jgi:hypothetical protein
MESSETHNYFNNIYSKVVMNSFNSTFIIANLSKHDEISFVVG